MRLPRPHIPIDVRCLVAARQLGRDWSIKGQSRTEKLRIMLKLLFPDGEWELDHNPALENRFFNKRTGKYTPDANNPDYLIYREKHAHKIKTLVRGDGAQLSDAAIARKRKRKERKAKRPKTRWPCRPMQSRSNWAK